MKPDMVRVLSFRFLYSNIFAQSFRRKMISVMGIVLFGPMEEAMESSARCSSAKCLYVTTDLPCKI